MCSIHYCNAKVLLSDNPFLTSSNFQISDIFSRLDNLAQRYYDRKLNTTSDPVTYVSIHVRRSDYGMYLNFWYKKTYVEDDYFAKAVQFYREKFKVRILRNFSPRSQLWQG